MEGGDGDDDPFTVEDVFNDFKGRRAGLIKALTTDAVKFYMLCDPRNLATSESSDMYDFAQRLVIVDLFTKKGEQKKKLSLWGFRDATWAVGPPEGESPLEFPAPSLGINYARDGMESVQSWLTFVAAHSDSWLLAVAFSWAAYNDFDKEERDRLFEMINNLPTVSEVVIEDGRMPIIEKHPKSSTKSNNSSLKSSPQSRRESPTLAPPEDEDIDGEGEDVLCGACGNEYFDEFWICCDVCDTWYHGNCVGITRAEAEQISKYECPSCSN